MSTYVHYSFRRNRETLNRERVKPTVIVTLPWRFVMHDGTLAGDYFKLHLPRPGEEVRGGSNVGGGTPFDAPSYYHPSPLTPSFTPRTFPIHRARRGIARPARSNF